VYCRHVTDETRSPLPAGDRYGCETNNTNSTGDRWTRSADVIRVEISQEAI